MITRDAQSDQASHVFETPVLELLQCLPNIYNSLMDVIHAQPITVLSK